MDACSRPERYWLYELPLQLAAALRRWARPGPASRRHRLVPGCALLLGLARSRHHASAWRARHALAWRLARRPGRDPAGSSEAPSSPRASARSLAGAGPLVSRAPWRAAGRPLAGEPRSPSGPAGVHLPAALAAVRVPDAGPMWADWTRVRRARMSVARVVPLPASLATALVTARNRVLTTRPGGVRVSPGRPPAWGAAAGAAAVRRNHEGGWGGAPADASIPHLAAVVRSREGGSRAAPADASVSHLTAAAVAPAGFDRPDGAATPVGWSEVAPDLAERVVAVGRRQQREGWSGARLHGHASSAPPAEPLGTAPLRWRTPVAVAEWPRLAQLMEDTVQRTVEVAVQRELKGQRTQETPGATGVRLEAQGAAAPVVVTDQMVAQVISKLRILSREERFRAGRLR